jgi:hypothetical protein
VRAPASTVAVAFGAVSAAAISGVSITVAETTNVARRRDGADLLTALGSGF